MSAQKLIVIEKRAKRGPAISIQDIEKEVFKKPLTKVHNKGRKYENKKQIVIEGYDFSINNKELEDDLKIKMCYVEDCEDIVIRRCRFSGIDVLVACLDITGAATKRVIVEYCIFEKIFTPKGLNNGGEPLRFGNSSYSGISFYCESRFNIFRFNAADPETISIKSVFDYVHDCYFISNRSNLTVRHGGYATIVYNWFEAQGGVRLLGYGNRVAYNVFKDFTENLIKFSPVVIQNATASKDPNWKDVKTPTEKAGKSHAIYAQNVDNEVFGNLFVNCRTTIYYRTDGGKLKPLSVKRSDNIEAKTWDDKLLVIDPQAVPEQPTTEPTEPEQPIPTEPEQPTTPTEPTEPTEPTDPVITPTEPEDPEHLPQEEPHLCMDCGKEEGKYIVKFYLCLPDLKAGIPILKKALQEMRATTAIIEEKSARLMEEGGDN